MPKKRTIYRVVKKKTDGWAITLDGYGDLLTQVRNKATAVAVAIHRAKLPENQPSQVLIYAKSRETGKYRITTEYSYGCDSKSKG